MSDNCPEFYGDFENIPIDTKGRLIVPAAFRNALPNGVSSIIVTQWFDGCLAAFDPDGWRRIIDQLRNMGHSQVQSRQLVRAMAGRASEVKLDRQGRASLPKKLLDRAGIGERLVVIGALEHLEFWEPEAWQGYLAQAEPTLEEVAETLDL